MRPQRALEPGPRRRLRPGVPVLSDVTAPDGGAVGPLGLLLAAGAGSRMGRPKALVHDPDGTSWLRRGVEVLRSGGCAEVTVVLGARADEARALVPDGAAVVEAADWAAGMSASLAAGLRAAGEGSAPAAVVLLVDLPDVGPAVVRRLVAGGTGPRRLARAAYDGTPGHPVVLGRDHWAGVLAGLGGDEGAAGYLRTHGVERVECGDLATGDDQDTPDPSLA